MKRTLTALAALALAVPTWAQGNPRGNAETTLGGKKVAIDYGRPSLKGRSFDELLKQLDEERIWRAGSEQVTTLHTEADLVIGGTQVPAGKYSLYVHAPETGDYALAVNKDPGVALGKIWAEAPPNLKNEPWPQMKYAPIAAQEVARIPLKKSAVEKPADQFTIGFTPAKEGAVLSLTWGDRSWTVDVAAAK